MDSRLDEELNEISFSRVLEQVHNEIWRLQMCKGKLTSELMITDGKNDQSLNVFSVFYCVYTPFLFPRSLVNGNTTLVFTVFTLIT